MKKSYKIMLCSAATAAVVMFGGILTVPVIADVKVKKKEYVAYYNVEDTPKIELEMEYKCNLPEFIKDFKRNQFMSNTYFSSENEDIVTVNTDNVDVAGQIQPVASGKTEVKIDNDDYDFHDSVNIQVHGKLEALKTENVTLSVLKPEQEVKIKMIPADAEPQDVVVQTLNHKIARAEGIKLVMVSPGTTRFSIRAGKIKVIGTVKVLSSPKKIKAKNISVVPGIKKKLTVTTDIKNPDIGKKFTYKSNNRKIAVVYKDGSVKGIAPGKATITIKNDTGLKTTATVKVLKVPHKLTVKDLKLGKNGQKKLIVKMDVSKPDAGKRFKFMSSNTKVAEVDKNGVVTAKSVGKAVITVENEYGLKTTCNVTVDLYPLSYHDKTADIEINKEWYNNAWCYIAHLKFTDYSRFGTYCANDKYGSESTVSQAAKQLNAIFCVNGCYSAKYLCYPVMRSGSVKNDKACTVPGVYSRKTGKFSSPADAGVYGSWLSSVKGIISDTFCFGPEFLVNGQVTVGNDTSRAQRTFIGTNGNPGDIYVVVSDGRMVDGKSAGLTYKECANLLKDKGCKFGIPLDGGGSSEMIFQGDIVNTVKQERDFLVDFVYFK